VQVTSKTGHAPGPEGDADKSAVHRPPDAEREFSSIVAEMEGRLIGYVINRLRKVGKVAPADEDLRCLAEDLAQTALALLWAQWPAHADLDGDRRRKYLWGITKNLVSTHIKNLIRARKHRNLLVPDLRDAMHPNTPNTRYDQIPHQAVLHQEAMEELHAHLDELPPAQRTSILLAADGIKPEQRAEQKGIRQGTERTQTSRARSAMRAAIENSKKKEDQ
jgi:RNA polymerase sigma factor (sigma-70 family)